MVRICYFQVFLSFVALLDSFDPTSSLVGGENEAARELVRLVGVDEADQWNEAPKLFATIAEDSKIKPIASQAMAILEIRQGNNSKAWKILASQSKVLELAPVPLRLGHEKLILWLLLEAESKDAAESQFKRLVTSSISQELPDVERRDAYSFLGSAIGMLLSAGDANCIPAATVEQGRTLLGTVGSKLALEQLRQGGELADQWHDDLQARIKEFENAGFEKSTEILKSQEQDYADAIRKESELKLANAEDRKKRNTLDHELKDFSLKQKKLQVELNTPTPGKPPQPSRPSQPKDPGKHYENVYTTDSKTGKVTSKSSETSASSAANREYSEERRAYPSKLRKYQEDMRIYPARLNAWERKNAARLADLQANKQLVDDGYSNTHKEIEDSKSRIRDRIEQSKATAKKIGIFHDDYLKASVAMEHTKLAAQKPKALARPSNFSLLDFESEVLRLERGLREVLR